MVLVRFRDQSLDRLIDLRLAVPDPLQDFLRVTEGGERALQLIEGRQPRTPFHQVPEESSRVRSDWFVVCHELNVAYLVL